MISSIDQNFASPKRKDCKLDMTCVPSVTKMPAPVANHCGSGVHAKRNHKKSAKAKKPAQAITKFFSPDKHINGDAANDSHSTVHTNGSANVEQTADCVIVNSSFSSSYEQAASIDNSKDDVDSPKKGDKPSEIVYVNGNSLLSPEAKSLQNGIKQTTPHRIVCRSSPTKKQRLLLKDPASVFSNLNIRDGQSPKGKNRTKNAEAKMTQQKSRRKLDINGTENCTGSETGTVASGEDAVPLTNGTGTADIDHTKKPILNRTIDPTALENSTNNNKVFAVPNKEAPRRVHETQMTDFFPIRRSNRKTKKTVEQELSHYIELAIEKQLEDGLIVKTFAEKGRGIVAGRPFGRGEFVVEYIGELIDQTEADRREEEYAKNMEFGCYMYYFKHKEQQWWLVKLQNTNVQDQNANCLTSF